MLPMDKENHVLEPLEILQHLDQSVRVRSQSICQKIDSFRGLCLAVEAGDINQEIVKIALDPSNINQEIVPIELTFRTFYNTHRIIKYIANDESVEKLQESLSAKRWKELKLLWPKVVDVGVLHQASTILFAAVQSDDSEPSEIKHNSLDATMQSVQSGTSNRVPNL